jgi:hypothetical protein
MSARKSTTPTKTKPTKRKAKRSKSKAKPSPEAYRKPRADLFTLVLSLALVFIITACIFLYFEMQLYDMKFRAERFQVPGNSGQVAVERFPGDKWPVEAHALA